MAFRSLTSERFPAQRHQNDTIGRPAGPAGPALSTRTAAAAADSNAQRNAQSVSLSVPGLVWSIALVLVSCLVFKFPLTTTSGSVLLFRLLSSAASRNSRAAISNQASARPGLPTSKGDSPLPLPAAPHGILVQRPTPTRVNAGPNRKVKKPRADTSAPPKATFSPASYQLLRAYRSGSIGNRKSPRRCLCCPAPTRNEGPSQVVQRLDPQMFWVEWLADRPEGVEGVGGLRSPLLGGSVSGPQDADTGAALWFKTWANRKSFPPARELFKDAQEAVKIAPSLSDVGLCVESTLMNPRKEVTENEHMDLDSEELLPGSNAYLYHYMAQQRTAKRISQLSRTGMLRARNGFEYQLLGDPFPGRMVSNPDYVPPPPRGGVSQDDLPGLLENDVKAEIKELDDAPWRPIRPPTPRYPDEVNPPPPRQVSTIRKRMFYVVDPVIPVKPSEYSPPSPTQTFFDRLEGKIVDPTTVLPPPRRIPPFVPPGDFKYLFGPTLRVYSEEFIRDLCHLRRPRWKRPVWSWSLVPLGRYSTGAREVSGRLPAVAELDEEGLGDDQASKTSTMDYREPEVELETPQPNTIDAESHAGEVITCNEDKREAEPVGVTEEVDREEMSKGGCNDVPFVAWDVEVAVVAASTPLIGDDPTTIQSPDATCDPSSDLGHRLEDGVLIQDLELDALSKDFLAQSTPQATSYTQTDPAEIASHAPDSLSTPVFDDDDPVFELGVTALSSSLPEVSAEVREDFVSAIELEDAIPVCESTTDSGVEVFLSAEDGGTGDVVEVLPVEALCEEGPSLVHDSSVETDAKVEDVPVGDGSDLVVYGDAFPADPRCASGRSSEEFSTFDDEEDDHLTDGGLSDAPSVFSQNIFYDDNHDAGSSFGDYEVGREGRLRPSRPLYLCDELDSPIGPRGGHSSPRPHTLDDKDPIPPSPKVARSRWAPAPLLLPSVRSINSQDVARNLLNQGLASQVNSNAPTNESEIPSSPQFIFNPFAEDDRSWAYNNDHANVPRRYMGYGFHHSQSQDLDYHRHDAANYGESTPRHESVMQSAPVYFHLPSRLRGGANASVAGSLMGMGAHEREGDMPGGVGGHPGSGARFRFHVVDVDLDRDVDINVNVNEGDVGGSGDLGRLDGRQWGSEVSLSAVSDALEVEDSELGLGQSASDNAVSGLGMEEGGSGSGGGANRKRRRGCRGGKRGKNRRARRNALSASSSAALVGGGTGDEDDDDD